MAGEIHSVQPSFSDAKCFFTRGTSQTHLSNRCTKQNTNETTAAIRKAHHTT